MEAVEQYFNNVREEIENEVFDQLNQAAENEKKLKDRVSALTKERGEKNREIAKLRKEVAQKKILEKENIRLKQTNARLKKAGSKKANFMRRQVDASDLSLQINQALTQDRMSSQGKQ